LIAGDVLINVDPLTQRPGLAEPPDDLTLDPEQNRRAIRRLAELQPRLVCFGHGPPIHGDASFQLAVEALGI
jgi:glyoxylase-like metal-dependent hydrolase (beta-lactamase superfamily II)